MTTPKREKPDPVREWHETHLRTEARQRRTWADVHADKIQVVAVLAMVGLLVVAMALA